MNRTLIAILWLGGLPLAGPAAAATTFDRALQAEQELRIYEARDLFRQALDERPQTPGMAEHTAWFLFLNGFHDEECRDLLRRAAPNGQEPAAMERAARHVERHLGLREPADDAGARGAGGVSSREGRAGGRGRRRTARRGPGRCR